MSLGLQVAVALLLALQFDATASELKHPVVEPIPESVLVADLSYFRELDAFQFPVTRDPRNGRPEFRLIQGKKWFLPYEAPKTGADGKPLPQTEILRHYRELTLHHNGKILYEDKDRLYFVIPESETKRVWCYLWTSSLGHYNLHILEETLPAEKGAAAGEGRNGTADQESLESIQLHSLLQKAEKDLLQDDRAAAILALQKAISAVEEGLPLAVKNVRLVEDTTHYRTRSSNVYEAGEPILISCLLTGHGFVRDGPNYVIDITTDFLILAADGKVLGSREEAFRFSHTSPAPVPEFPLDLSYVITDAPKGTYSIHTVVRDINSGKQAKFINDIVIR
jgi:hypothetical protein